MFWHLLGNVNKSGPFFLKNCGLFIKPELYIWRWAKLSAINFLISHKSCSLHINNQSWISNLPIFSRLLLWTVNWVSCEIRIWIRFFYLFFLNQKLLAVEKIKTTKIVKKVFFELRIGCWLSEMSLGFQIQGRADSNVMGITCPPWLI